MKIAYVQVRYKESQSGHQVEFQRVYSLGKEMSNAFRIMSL